jgi:DNA-binding Lrp family transcriptional regulator
MLVIRRARRRSERFNELRRGLPRMSPTLLSKRLDQLVRAGVVEHIGAGPDGRYGSRPQAASYVRSWRPSARGEFAGSASSATATSIPSC